MFKRLLLFALMAAVAASLGCKKQPPSRDDTHNALREAAQRANDDVYDAECGQVLICSDDQLGAIPLFGGYGFRQLQSDGGKEAYFRALVKTLNSGGPWDTLAGRWQWVTDSFGWGSWSHYSTTPTDSIIFEWAWQDSTQTAHSADLGVFSWSWDRVDTFDVLTQVHAQLRSDGRTCYRLDLNEVGYGSSIDDIRKIDVAVTAASTKFVFVLDYAPPNASATLRMESSASGAWYEIGLTVRDETAPLGDGAVVKAGSYKDYGSWTIGITLTDPDEDYIQLVEGEIKHKGTLAAVIKSEKRYENEYPYLYVWVEYVDGSTETIEELFSGIGPYGGK